MSLVHAQNLKKLTQKTNPELVFSNLLNNPLIPACTNQVVYSDFKLHVQEILGNQTEAIFIAGSGNWGFSLNPKNEYRDFGAHSDIDLCIISPSLFDEVWLLIRAYHRKSFYLLGSKDQMYLRRNGENVYSGFVSPKWIGDRANKFRLDFEIKLNKMSSSHVGYKTVNAFIFKNFDEAIDYYKRGVVALLKDKKV